MRGDGTRAGEGDMAGEQIPEAWIGEQVALRFWRGDDRRSIECKLEAVNDRGVVVLIETEEEKSRPRFYPWSAVLQIRLGVEG
jgi:hypothetical protein